MSETSLAYLTDGQLSKVLGFPYKTPAPEHLITTAELAQELRMSEQWVRDHAAGRRQPQIPAIRLSGERRPTYRFKLSEVIECLTKRFNANNP